MSLPLVFLLMAILAIAVTAGFARVSEERRIVGDQQAQVDAFAVAQSGLGTVRGDA
jgi:Tfp pilus assembly protein PilX